MTADDENRKSADASPAIVPPPPPLLPPITYYCALQGCRSVEEFQCLNKIEEGAYGVVYRAQDKKTSEILISFL